ncbi:MAG: NAD(P)-dependent oxidoreductase [Pseudomonadota bacterium]
MKILVTGSAGHLGEALMRGLRETAHEAVGIDVLASPFTAHVGSIADRTFVARAMRGIDAVLHVATLHKPHVATHSKQAFIDTNITGTLNLLEEAAAAQVGAFVFTSTTSSFGDAMAPKPGAPAVWVDEALTPIPKNIYGVTKLAAEDLCSLFQRQHGLPCIVLRTSRFFPERDDEPDVRARYSPANTQVNELLNRRVDIEDVFAAQLCAIACAAQIGFGRYLISATAPFTHDELQALRDDLPAVVARHVPQYAAEYAKRGWTMAPGIDRVYVNAKARAELGWRPKHDFASAIDALRAGRDHQSALARQVGAKGYHPTAQPTTHPTTLADGPYTVA